MRPLPEEPTTRGTQTLDAKKAHDSLYGAALHAITIWKRIAIFESVILIFAIAGLIYLGAISKVSAFYVRYDDHLKTQIIPISDSNASLSEQEVVLLLKQFIFNLRTVTPDAILVNKLRKDAFYYTSSQAKQSFQKLMGDTDPLAPSKPGQPPKPRQVSVNVKTVFSSTKSSFQITWDEISYDKNGNELQSIPFAALVTYSTTQPDSEEALRENPLGFYISALQLGPEMTQDKK